MYSWIKKINDSIIPGNIFVIYRKNKTYPTYHTIHCCLHQYQLQTPNYIGTVSSAHEKLKQEMHFNVKC